MELGMGGHAQCSFTSWWSDNWSDWLFFKCFSFYENVSSWHCDWNDWTVSVLNRLHTENVYQLLPCKLHTPSSLFEATFPLHVLQQSSQSDKGEPLLTDWLKAFDMTSRKTFDLMNILSYSNECKLIESTICLKYPPGVKNSLTSKMIACTAEGPRKQFARPRSWLPWELTEIQNRVFDSKKQIYIYIFI